jgi:hypothetical protein
MSEKFSIQKIISKKENGVKRYIGKKDGEKYFVKECKNKTKLEREFGNQKFLYNLSQKYDTGFKFLEPKKLRVKSIIQYWTIIMNGWQLVLQKKMSFISQKSI